MGVELAKSAIDRFKQMSLGSRWGRRLTVQSPSAFNVTTHCLLGA